MLASLFLDLIAVVCAAMVVASYRYRRIPAAAPLGVLFIGLTIWSFAYSLELSSVTLEGKLLWTRIQYIGILAAPASWLAFVIQYGRPGRPLRKRMLALLLIEPAIVQLLLWTNDSHRVFYRSVALVANEALGSTMRIEYGPAFWVHVGYAYLLMLLAVALMFQQLVRAPHSQRRTIGAIMVGALVPWLGNMLYLSGLSVLDLTAFGFMVFGLICAWSMFRMGLLDLVPVARDALVESMADGVIVIDQRDRVVDINPAGLVVLRRTRQEVVGQELPVLLAHRAEIVERYRSVAGVHDELLVEQVEGPPRWFDLQISPLNDSAGQRSGRLIVLRDITEQKRNEAALRAAKEAAEVASRAKSAFLGHVSHELRTPLTAILGYGELIQREAEDRNLPTLAADMQRITDSGQHLLTMICDLLDLTEIEAGTVTLSVAPISPRALAESAAEAARSLIDQHGNQLLITCAEPLGLIYSDAVKIRRVLLHLLSNAAKFTEGGTINLVVRREADPGDLGSPEPRGMVVFEVIDTGVGIGPEQIGQLFQPLSPGEGASLRRRGGMGVGLAIAHQLCVLLGGSIAAESTLGQGTVFTVRVPDLAHRAEQREGVAVQ
jgi:PAS domain S-box-containing protein